MKHFMVRNDRNENFFALKAMCEGGMYRVSSVCPAMHVTILYIYGF